MWKPDENDFAAPGANSFNGSGRIAKATSDRLPNFCHEHIFRNVSGRRWRCEKRDPNLLNSSRQFSVWIGTRFNHPSAPLAIKRPEIGRKPRRDECSGAIRNWQTLQQFAQIELLLLEKRDAFFQRHGEIFAGALGRRLIMKPFYDFFPDLHWR